MNISQHNKEALKNPWVWGMIIFLIIFLAANAVFIFQAFKFSPDLVVEDFYERGKRYEDTQKRIEAEKALGWTGILQVPSKTRVNQQQSYDVLIQGRNSVSLALDSVTMFAYRPSDAEADFVHTMTHKSPGTYTVNMAFTLPGIWDLIVVAKQGEQEFLITKRVTISP